MAVTMIKFKEKILCDNCRKFEATMRDYRTYDDLGEIISCKYCVTLNDVWHSRVREKKLNPKKVLEDD